MDVDDKIIILKAEIFDLLKKQNGLQNQLNQMEQAKQTKLKELNILEKGNEK